MKRLSRKDLEVIANRVIRAYMKLPEVANQPVYRIYPEILAESLLGLKIDYQHLSFDGSILGMTSYERVGMRECVEQNGRRNFTIMHETSHQVLKMLFPQDYGAKPHERPIHFCKANTVRRNPISDWEEWQSNALASVMLLPKSLVEQAMRLFDVQGGIRMLNKVFAKEEYDRFVGMTELLGCSKTALAIRMKQLGYIGMDYLDNPYRLLDVEEY